MMFDVMSDAIQLYSPIRKSEKKWPSVDLGLHLEMRLIT